MSDLFAKSAPPLPPVTARRASVPARHLWVGDQLVRADGQIAITRVEVTTDSIAAWTGKSVAHFRPAELVDVILRAP